MEPEYLTVAFDVKKPTFRHEMFKEYKGTRKPMPEELRQQVPVIQDVLEAMGITIVKRQGFEADDILGTIAKMAEAEGKEVTLVSGDRDLLQLATKNIKISIPFSLGGEEFCRSKDGDENSYASSRKENMLDWENVDLYSDVIEYYRGLYKIRDAFAAFSDSTAATANSLTYLSDVPKGVTGYTINNTESGKWSQMCVIFNGSDSAQNVTAKGDWVVLADNKTAGLRNIKNVTNSVKVEAHSAVIMVDTKSYDSAGIMDDEGAVVIDYYDNKTEKLIKSQTLTGELGTSYDVTNLASTLNYDVKKTDGEIKGVFTDQVGHAKVYVEEYDGEISTVTVKFVDETNNTEIEDSFLVKNRKGEQYYTPDLPSIKNYKLVLDDLPTNGAGKLDSASKAVTYKYTRVTDDEDKTVCRVNAIYMDDSGKKNNNGQFYY